MDSARPTKNMCGQIR